MFARAKRFVAMASVEIRHAKKFDEWAATRRERGELPTVERREAFKARQEARQFLKKAAERQEVSAE